MKTLTKLAVVVIMLTLTSPACVVDDFTEVEENTPSISSQQAQKIALDYVNDSQYKATSAIFGSYSKMSGVKIWAVNLLSEEIVVSIYLDAETGEVYEDESHKLSEEKFDGQDGILPQRNGGMCAGYCHWALYVHIPGFYSQNYSTWSGDILGWGPTRIYQEGCHLAVTSMILFRFGYRDKDPGQLNQWAKNNGCFVDSNLLNANCVMPKHGNRTRRDIGVDEIWGNLANNIPVVVRVKYGRGHHFMLIYGHDGSRYWVKDPLQDGRHQNQPLYGEADGPSTFRVYN